MNIEFLKKFIPYSEMAVILDNIDEHRDDLERLESQIRAVPTLEGLRGIPEDEIRVKMHYFGGSTDIWVFALDPSHQYGEAFVCLNGDSWNAETGPIYFGEILPIPLFNLDLHWNSDTRLKEVIDKVKRDAG